MANDRMYIYDKNSKQYVCIAKEFSDWSLGNRDLLNEFLNEPEIRFDGDLFIICESSDEHWPLIRDGINYNKEGGWI